MSILGRRNIIIASFVLKTFSILGFLLVKNVETRLLFVILLILLNIILAVSSSAYRTSVYSALTTMYPEDVNFAVSCFETSSGIGFSLGPAIASLLYAQGGYNLPFLVFLTSTVILALLITTLIPSYINESNSEPEGETDVTYWSLLKNRRVLFACIIIGLNAITYDFLNPILGDVLETFYGLDEQAVGWMF